LSWGGGEVKGENGPREWKDIQTIPKKKGEYEFFMGVPRGGESCGAIKKSPFNSV